MTVRELRKALDKFIDCSTIPIALGDTDAKSMNRSVLRIPVSWDGSHDWLAALEKNAALSEEDIAEGLRIASKRTAPGKRQDGK